MTAPRNAREQIAFADVAELPVTLPCDADFLDWPCRYEGRPGHVHRRRDGREADAYSCHAEHRHGHCQEAKHLTDSSSVSDEVAAVGTDQDVS